MINWLKSNAARPYIRLLVRVLATFAVLLALWFVVPMVLSLFLPFIIAFIVAVILNPGVSFLQKKLKVPRGLLSVMCLAAGILAVAGLIGWFVFALTQEILALAQNIDVLLETVTLTVQNITEHLEWLSGYLPWSISMAGVFDSFSLWLQEQARVVTDSIVQGSVDFTARIGGGVITFVVFLMASYFMIADYLRINVRMRKVLGKKFFGGYMQLKNAALFAVGRYIRAQLLLGLIVFIISLIALALVGQQYGMLIALALAVIDTIPLVGAGIVLIPWGVISILTGEFLHGLYLFGLSFVIFLMRRVLEPKIMSTQSGLSPLMALISIYLGLQLMGVLGMILGPIAAMVILNFKDSGLFDGWIKDVRAVVGRKG